MNFNGLTKEAKVELSHLFYMISENPEFKKQKELILLVRECVNSEIRTHVINEKPAEDITTHEVKWHNCATDCKGELNLAEFDHDKDKDISKLDGKTISQILKRLEY